MIRRPEQAGDLLAAGAEPVVCDLESASVEEVARHLQDADAAVFAAGAGPGSGIERKESVDRGAASLFADAAEAAGVRRFLVVSSMGADREPPEGTDPVFAAYLRAKGAADADVRARAGLDWTILRPGRLTDDPGTGLVTLADATGRGRGDAGRCRGRPRGAARRAGHDRPDAGTDQRRCPGRRGGPRGGRALSPGRTTGRRRRAHTKGAPGPYFYDPGAPSHLWRRQDSNLGRRSRQIYSLLPLAARAHRQGLLPGDPLWAALCGNDVNHT